MWIFFSDSFLSVVAHRDLPDCLLVRARRAGDIEAVFPDAAVSETPDADYLYRAVVPRDVVADTLARRAYGIDYDNFKASVADRSLLPALHSIWETMWRVQRENADGSLGRATRRPK